MELKEAKLPIYFDLEAYEDFGMSLPLKIDFKGSPHMVISGESGSGKTFASKLLLASIGKFVEDAEVYILDYKNDGDFDYLTGHERYFGGDDCERGLEVFYERFEDRRNKRELDSNHVFLFFDEYAAFSTMYEGSDRELKKKGDNLKKKFGALMRMGRSFGMHIITALQRADSNYFPYGARENFAIRLGLGVLSPESKTMLFESQKEEIDDSVGGNGKGYMLVKGQPIKSVIVPQVNMEKINREIELFIQKGVVCNVEG